MNIQQYLELIKITEINPTAIESFEQVFKFKPNDYLEHLLSVEMNDYFIGDEYRVISLKEILNPQGFFGVDFVDLKMIPLVDLMDGDYIIYNIQSEMYEAYNVYDEIAFIEASSLELVFKELES